MNESSRSNCRPVDEVAAAQNFYAGLGQDVGYFSALWHTFNVGHMLATDLSRICRKHGLSVADFNLMGALRIDRERQLRATDLAVILQVSNGALTTRIARLVQNGMLIKSPAVNDRRAHTFALSAKAETKVEAIHSTLAQASHFVRVVSKLPAEDRATLERIMGELHGQLGRHFIHAHR